jgi:hypothetical protein
MHTHSYFLWLLAAIQHLKCSRNAQLYNLKLPKIKPNQVLSLESEVYQSITLKTIFRRSLRIKKRRHGDISLLPSISEGNVCRIFIKFGIEVFCKTSHKHDFHENRLSYNSGPKWISECSFRICQTIRVKFGIAGHHVMMLIICEFHDSRCSKRFG